MAIRYSPKQVEIYRAPEGEHDRIISIGPVRSGKTLPAVEGYLSWATKEPEHDYMFTTRTLLQFNRVVKPLVEGWCKLAGMPFEIKRQESLMRVGDTTFYYGSASDEQAYEKITGLTLRGNYFDEVTLIPEAYFDQLELRMVGQPGARTVATANPAGLRHWVRMRFIAPGAPEAEETNVIETEMLDNPIITPEEFERLKQRYHGSMRDRMIFGKWADMVGVIYPLANVTIEPVPPSAPVMSVLSCDYAHSSVAHWSLFSLYPEGWWLAREGRHDANEEGLITDAALSDKVRRWLGGTRPRRIYMDPAAQGWATALAQALGRKVHNADNRVKEGIVQTRAFLDNGILRIDPGCMYTQGEMSMYVWDKKAAARGEDKPVKADDHAMDTLRYFAMTHRKHVVRRAA